MPQPEEKVTRAEFHTQWKWMIQVVNTPDGTWKGYVYREYNENPIFRCFSRNPTDTWQMCHSFVSHCPLNPRCAFPRDHQGECTTGGLRPEKL